MFNFFKSEKGTAKVVDKVWMYKRSKWKACQQMLSLNDHCLFVVWFDNTFKEMQQAMQLPDDSHHLMLAENMTAVRTKDRMVVFAEHYPLTKVEQAVFLKLNLNEVPVLSSLDEPLFQRFGGEKLIEMMQKSGMHEEDIIAHRFVTKSIANAQRSIGKATFSDVKANSQEEWFEANVKVR